ncbi:MAG: hypothetical protein K5917_00405 [Clostridiales bacterium]|nr:hypothetical protein [Clostridiales bacterium]
MKVSFNGFNETNATFETATALDKGALVKMSSNGKVAACTEDDKFIGVVIHSEDDVATVQLNGYIRVAYSGTAPSVGYAKLLADTTGKKVSVDADGREYLVIDVDTTNSFVGIIL